MYMYSRNPPCLSDNHYLRDKVDFYIYIIMSNKPSYDKFHQYRNPRNGMIPFGLGGSACGDWRLERLSFKETLQ
jgi:hypothetical protein